MCGLTGILFAPTEARQRLAEVSEALRRMTEALKHRGPDDSGMWVDGRAGTALGHRRLAIIDLTPAGHQPMESTCGRYVTVYNGEIYNFETLRSELEADGMVFRGRSDTEVFLACVSRHGFAEALPRFNGMFAIALWDKEDRVLRLARDRFGEKPLYYGAAGDAFVFGSELKALAACPTYRAKIDRRALAAYFRYGFVPQPLSIYGGIFKVPPGSWIEIRFDGGSGAWKAGRPSLYWSAREAVAKARSGPFTGTEEEAVAELEFVLGAAVRDRLVSDVPLGAFLSGGIDSSAVVSLMRAVSGKVRTFSIGFAEASHDESAYAAAVADVLGTEHVSAIVTAREVLDVIPKLPTLYDEPFADSSQIPTYIVSSFARRQVTVSLSGDGGDELFGGYVRHLRGPALWERARRLPPALRGALGKALRAVPAGALEAISTFLGRKESAERHFGDKAHKLARALRSESAFEFYLSLLSSGADSDVVLDGDAGTDPLRDSLADAWDERAGFAENAMLCDVLGYLESDILTKVDRASMGVGLEVRVPFLDPRVFEFAWRLPTSLKIRSGIGKIPVRKLLERHVPRGLFDRPKTGFHMPVGEWLRGPLKEWGSAMLDPASLRAWGDLDDAIVSRLWNEHQSGRFNHESALWGVLMFQTWLAEREK